MVYEVTIETVDAQPMAAVAAQSMQRELPQAIPQALDKVYAVLRSGGHGKLGCNTVFYASVSPDGPMELMVGVRLNAPFEAAPGSDVVAFSTPAGEVAHVVYFGDYSQMLAAHQAAQARARELGRLSGFSWEIYGDWSDDPSELRTDIYYLLTPTTREGAVRG